MPKRRAGAHFIVGALTTVAVLILAFAAQQVWRGAGGANRSEPTVSPSTCTRPYAAASPWNTPIGARPGIHVHSEQHVQALGGPLTSDPTQYTYPVYEVRRGAPREVVRVQGVFSLVTDRGRRLRILKRPTLRIPIPDRAQAAAGSDAQMIIVDRRTGDEWGVWRARQEADGWRIQNGYRYNLRWSGVPPRDANGAPFGSRGAGIPYLAGLVRPCEIARGRIDHALAFAYDHPTSAYVYPASKSDGLSSDAFDLPEGSRLQLDPRLSRHDLRQRGCVGACWTIARALQRYGMYVVDNSGRPKLMLEYEATARWWGQNAKTVSPIPMDAFRVLDTSSSRR